MIIERIFAKLFIAIDINLQYGLCVRFINQFLNILKAIVPTSIKANGSSSKNNESSGNHIATNRWKIAARRASYKRLTFYEQGLVFHGFGSMVLTRTRKKSPAEPF